MAPLRLGTSSSLGVRVSCPNPASISNTTGYPSGTFVAFGSYTNTLSVLLTHTNSLPYSFAHKPTHVNSLPSTDVLRDFVGYTETVDGTFLPKEVDAEGLATVATTFNRMSREEVRRSEGGGSVSDERSFTPQKTATAARVVKRASQNDRSSSLPAARRLKTTAQARFPLHAGST